MPPELDGNNSVKNIKIPIFTLLYRLFFDPLVFSLLRYHRVTMVLILVVSLCLVSGLLISVGTVLRNIDSVDEWKEWLRTDIHEFGITADKKFFWKNSLSLPYTKQVGDWQVHITSQLIFKKDQLGLETSDRGVWIGPDSIHLWIKSRSGNFLSNTEKEHLKTIDLGKSLLRLHTELNADKFLVEKGEISDFVNRLISTTVLIIILFNIFSVVFISLFLPCISSTLSAVSLCLVRRGKLFPNFSKMLVLNLYISIPPILVATACSLLKLPGINFFMVFFIAYFCFHLFIISVNHDLYSPS